jgi:hypothetical protein
MDGLGTDPAAAADADAVGDGVDASSGAGVAPADTIGRRNGGGADSNGVGGAGAASIVSTSLRGRGASARLGVTDNGGVRHVLSTIRSATLTPVPGDDGDDGDVVVALTAAVVPEAGVSVNGRVDGADSPALPNAGSTALNGSGVSEPCSPPLPPPVTEATPRRQPLPSPPSLVDGRGGDAAVATPPTSTLVAGGPLPPPPPPPLPSRSMSFSARSSQRLKDTFQQQRLLEAAPDVKCTLRFVSSVALRPCVCNDAASPSLCSAVDKPCRCEGWR